MEILTVKISGDGWLVNGKYSVPNDPSNRHYALVQEAIANGIVVEPRYSQAELNAQAAEEAEEVAAGQVKAAAALKNFIKLGPSGIETYINTNVTDMASAKQVLILLAKIVWVVARNQFK